MRVKESFRDAVRIIVMIHMFMMAPMFARPHQDRIFESGRAEDQREDPDRPAGLKGKVGEQPMITYRDAKSASGKHGKEKYHLEPIKPEEPEIEWDSGERYHERPDKKRTR